MAQRAVQMPTQPPEPSEPPEPQKPQKPKRALLELTVLQPMVLLPMAVLPTVLLPTALLPTVLKSAATAPQWKMPKRRRGLGRFEAVRSVPMRTWWPWGAATRRRASPCPENSS